MRRWIILGAIVLGLGVLTTYGTAWGVALWGDHVPMLTGTGFDFPGGVPTGPVERVDWVVAKGLEPRRIDDCLHETHDRHPSSTRAGDYESVFMLETLRPECMPEDVPLPRPIWPLADEWRYGWPWRCVRYRRWVSMLPPVQEDDRVSMSIWALDESDPGLRRRRNDGSLVTLAVVPIAVPFLGSVLLYGGAWGAMILAALGVRRWRRRRAGRCLHCAYPVGRSAVCTECGGRLRGV